MESEGRSDARTLRGGEIVGMTKPPNEEWQIRYFESSQRVRYDIQAQGFVLEWLQGVPSEWRNP